MPPVIVLLLAVAILKSQATCASSFKDACDDPDTTKGSNFYQTFLIKSFHFTTLFSTDKQLVNFLKFGLANGDKELRNDDDHEIKIKQKKV